MYPRIKQFQGQAKQQSCTALAIKCTLHEFNIETYTGTVGGELILWDQLKRGTTVGQEEILPHKAIAYLKQRGCTVELIQDTTRTKPLKMLAPKDYAEYKGGLTSMAIPRVKLPLDLDKHFAKDARVFMIVGFIDAKLGKLATHAVLCRIEGGDYWVLNPDGGTDKAYSRSQVESFLAHADPKVQGPEFGSKKIYVYTGIAYRVTL